jgi:hypothetical protein
VEANIINLFGFILQNNILEWGKNFVHDQPNCTFEKLEQAVCKHFPNYEEQQRSLCVVEEPPTIVGGWVEVYYEHLLKLANYLQVKAINVFLITIFKARLQPYCRLAIVSMVINSIIKHKEVAIIYEDNGLVISNYNTLITQLESKSVAQPIITYATIKQ